MWGIVGIAAVARAIPRVNLRGALLALALAVSPAAASAQCTFWVVEPMTFTNYSPFGTGVQVRSRIVYSCQDVAQAWIGIATPRVINAGGESLQLETYQDAGRSTVWPSAPPRPVGSNYVNVTNVYGFLPPQDAAAGSYSGTLQLSIYSGTSGNLDQTVSLNVTANVAPVCIINPATLAFGNYYPYSPGALDAEASIQLRCTRNTPYTVGLGAGNNPAGPLRQMANGARRLQYQLYSNAGRTAVWDTTATVGATAPSTALVDLPVFGRIAPGQLVAPGSYQDRVVSTINF